MRFQGEHTEAVTLKKVAITTNSYNEEVEDWDSNDVTIAVEFWERPSREVDSGGQVIAIQDVRCNMRYRADLDPSLGHTPEKSYRIERGSIVYDIEGIMKEGRARNLKLMLKRRDNR